MEQQHTKLVFDTSQGKKVRLIVDETQVWFNSIDAMRALILCGGGETDIEPYDNEKKCWNLGTADGGCYVTGQGLLCFLSNETNNAKCRRLILEMLSWIDEARMYY